MMISDFAGDGCAPLATVHIFHAPAFMPARARIKKQTTLEKPNCAQQ
jgi:hypothetical protein